MRIVTLTDTATGIVVALGLADQLVATSSHGQTLRRDHLKELAPDLCVAGEPPGAELSHTVVVTVAPSHLREIFEGIERVAEAAGVSERGRRLRSELEQRIESLRTLVDEHQSDDEGPTVAALTAIEPLEIAGGWMAELIELAGGTSVLADAGEPARTIGYSDLCAADPDAILVALPGRDLMATMQELSPLEQRDGWDGLTAVRTRRVWVVDGSEHFGAGGPGIVDSLRLLIERMWPDIDSAAANDRRAAEMLEKETAAAPSMPSDGSRTEG